jgi:hypothetical protein
MKVWGLWFGGSGYSPPGLDDLEEFESMRAAASVFEGRLYNRETPATPCVDEETSEMWIFLSKPEEGDDIYPDRTIDAGPRGGIRTTRI